MKPMRNRGPYGLTIASVSDYLILFIKKAANATFIAVKPIFPSMMNPTARKFANTNFIPCLN